MKVEIGEFPEALPGIGIDDFLNFPIKPLSERASRGFLKRAREGKLKFVDGFLDAIEAHADNMSDEQSKKTKVA